MCVRCQKYFTDFVYHFIQNRVPGKIYHLDVNKSLFSFKLKKFFMENLQLHT